MEQFKQQEFIDLLASHKGKWLKIARTTGLHHNTIRGIANGTIPNPGVKTVNLLLQGIEALNNTVVVS